MDALQVYYESQGLLLRSAHQESQPKHDYTKTRPLAGANIHKDNLDARCGERVGSSPPTPVLEHRDLHCDSPGTTSDFDLSESHASLTEQNSDDGIEHGETIRSLSEVDSDGSQAESIISFAYEEDDCIVPLIQPLTDHLSYLAEYSATSNLVDPLSITISDDQSVAGKAEERHLLALKILLPEVKPTVQVQATGNHALQDYQMQLMLLEQQNKKRLMMARQEQGQALSGQGSATADIDSSYEVIPFNVGESSKTGSNRNDKRPLDTGTQIDPEDVNSNVEHLDHEALQEYVQRLQKRLRHMSHQPAPEVPFRYKTFYRVLHQVISSDKNSQITTTQSLSPAYFDPPEWWMGQGTKGAFRCSIPVENIDLYFEKNKDIAFIVYKTYVEPAPDELANYRRNNTLKKWRPTINESIRPVQQNLLAALLQMLEAHDEYSMILQTFRSTLELLSPYPFFFHNRSDFDAVHALSTDTLQKQLALLLDYVMNALGDVYLKAQSMLSQSTISTQYLEYLFKPGDTVVRRDREGQYTGWVATTWLKKTWSELRSRQDAEALVRRHDFLENGPAGGAQILRKDKVLLTQWVLYGWQWAFDVTFYRKHENLLLYTMQENESNEHDIEYDSIPKTETPIPISELGVMPIRFCPATVVDTLRRRGQTFWKCRELRFVSYLENENDLLSGEERYIVDHKTYKSLHPDKFIPSVKPPDDLGEVAMKQGKCPEEHFELLLPLKIKGFNLRRKKWYDLAVDRISDVVWKKEAFKKVVMDAKAKEIVRALVSKQLASERSTDLIAGKGNGLILLLHGPPGTGKTLTAESVAEIAEKPLYRVTCGDVGTKAEAVEKYLESVFHLGKLWGCVVLVDEADVFLEQRDLKDLDRNALVSVFLRVLEYYEGILVLTSNRVGTFDEAFRSRIQLALHYPTLNQYQRSKIWENFFDRLENFNEAGSVNISDLRYHLEDLSQKKMNGREIRNAITTARQYAEYMGTTLTYSHLKDVIEIAGRFDQYLNDLNGGYTQDEIQKDGGIR